MQYIYIATTFAGAIICFLASLLLFVRRKTGERARTILAAIVLISVFNYIPRFINSINGVAPDFVVSAKMLLVAIFMVIINLIYPIEVISPRWLNLKRTFYLFSPFIFLVVLYNITLLFGVEYTPYKSILEMLPNIGDFDVLFRLFLALMILIPSLFIIVLHRYGRYKNTDNVWITKYTIPFFITLIAYLVVLIYNHPIVNIMYYYVGVGCNLYRIYLELFDRLIGTPVEETVVKKQVAEPKNNVLIDRLDVLMKKSSAWRDPDLSLNTLASELCTNRTTLAQVLRESGYENYTNYINRLRVEDFLKQIESGEIDNYQDAFFFVGFRSRSTALRNFRQFTGKTPSEYFEAK